MHIMSIKTPMHFALFHSFLLAVLVSPVEAQFLAYNDHAPGAGTAAHTTTWDVFGSPPGSTGRLKDSKTGADLPVTLTISITPTGVTGASTQGSPAAGT